MLMKMELLSLNEFNRDISDSAVRVTYSHSEIDKVMKVRKSSMLQLAAILVLCRVLDDSKLDKSWPSKADRLISSKEYLLKINSNVKAVKAALTLERVRNAWIKHCHPTAT